MTNRIAALLVVSASILTLGYTHGRITNRWGGDDAVLLRAAERLESIPNEIAGWVGEDGELSEREIQGAEAKGYLVRRYVNGETGESVQVMILCGNPGPISVHPPTVCFVGGGARQATTEQDMELSGVAAGSEFRHAVFVGTDIIETAQRTYWSWSPDGKTWTAPEGEVRLEFAGEPYLYKMYFTMPVQRDFDSDAFEATSESETAFMETMIGVLAEHLGGEGA